MARTRDPRRDQAQEMWKESGGTILIKEIAEKLDLSEGTLRVWKNRDNWGDGKTVTLQKNKRNVTREMECGATKKEHKKWKKSTIEKVAASIEANPELTEKQRLFCMHYANSNNAAQAYLKAYDCNYMTAKQEGYANLRKPHVKAEISRLKKIMRAEIDFDVLDLLHYCLRVVGADIGDYLTFGQYDISVIGPEGPVKDQKGEPMTVKTNYVLLGASDKLDTSLISEIKQSKDGISIKLADKKWAWEQLIKYFDLLPDKEKREIDRARLELERDKVQIMRDKEKIDEESEDSDHVQILDDVKGASDANNTN